MRTAEEIRRKLEEMQQAYEEGKGENEQYAGNLEALQWVLGEYPYLD